MTSPTVSVVIPLYNKAAYVGRTIDSIRAQRFADFEILVVDDESKDGGDRIVEEIACDEPRLRLLRRPNGGQSAARNDGIAAARGDIVAFLDADDQWLPGYLDAIVALRRRFPEAGLLATGYRTVFPRDWVVDITIDSAEEQTLIRDYFRRARQAPVAWVGAAAVPASVLAEVGGFAEGEHMGGDRDMWGRIALRWPVAYDRRMLVLYRADAEGRENPKTSRSLQSPPFAASAANALADPQRPAEEKADIEEYLNSLRLGYLRKCLRAGNREEFRATLRGPLAASRAYRRKVKGWRVADAFLPTPALYFLARVCASRWILRGRRDRDGAITDARRKSEADLMAEVRVLPQPSPATRA